MSLNTLLLLYLIGGLFSMLYFVHEYKTNKDEEKLIENFNFTNFMDMFVTLIIWPAYIIYKFYIKIKLNVAINYIGNKINLTDQFLTKERIGIYAPIFKQPKTWFKVNITTPEKYKKMQDLITNENKNSSNTESLNVTDVTTGRFSTSKINPNSFP